jgi:hypothetical protein
MYQSIVNSDTNARHARIAEVSSPFSKGKKIVVIGNSIESRFEDCCRMVAKNEQERISAWRAAMRMDADIVVVDGVSREEEGIYSRDLGCDVVVGFSA